MRVPQIKRLWDERQALIDERDQLLVEKSKLQRRAPADIFRFAFGEDPTPSELQVIDAFPPGEEGLTTLRRLLTMYDRQAHSSPITVRFRSDDISEVQRNGFKLMSDRFDGAVGAHLVAGAEYEPHLETFVRKHLTLGMHALDIGANVGYFTMAMASIVGDAGHIHAFEPNTENCRLLLLNQAVNEFTNVTLHPFALSSENGTAYYAPQIGSNGSFMPSDQQTLMHPNCVVIPTMRLDEVINDKVNFIKADIEGAEYLALSGGEQLIRKHKPIITIEFSLEMTERVSGVSGKAFLEWITALGYSIRVLERTGGERSVSSVDELLSSWGNYLRIEDLALVPTAQ